VVNWNGGDQLVQATQALRASRLTEENAIELTVVDNGSVDSSLSWLRREDSEGKLRLIELGKNMGFAHASNVGALNFDGEFLLFLNPDTRVAPDSVQRAITVIKRDTAGTIGIVGIQSYGDDDHIQKTCARFPTAWNFINEALGFAALGPSIFPGLRREDFDHARSEVVDHVIGAFYLVRAEVFRRLGGFDERFFVYLEDLDFSLRARQAGYSCFFLADARMYHKGGGVSEKVKDRRLYYSLQSRILFAFKHLTPPLAWLVTIVTLGIEPLPRLLRALLRGSANEMKNTGRAYLMLFKALPKILGAT
jgi:GT2 family glycosyltransferase